MGSRIGPYKLLQQIGEGGMGVVFMAEQQGECSLHPPPAHAGGSPKRGRLAKTREARQNVRGSLGVFGLKRAPRFIS